MTIHLICCTQVICNEIEQGVTQKDIALSYAMALRSYAAGADEPDWVTINKAIVDRWSWGGLERVKKRAWDILSGKVKP